MRSLCTHPTANERLNVFVVGCYAAFEAARVLSSQCVVVGGGAYSCREGSDYAEWKGNARGVSE